MDVMMRAGHHQRSGSNLQNTDYDLDTAHTVEVQREVDENGELGSFGFTLNYEKPPIVGTIVPGGPADKAGLKKQEVVVAVNGTATFNLTHHEVVSIIFNTKTPGVWLTVCEGPEQPFQREHTPPSSLRPSLGFNRVQSLGSFSMSQSSPVIPRNMVDAPRYSTADDSPPKYQDIPKMGRQGSGNTVLRQRDPVPPGTGMSPLTKNLLTQSVQYNGYSSSSSVLHHKPTLQNSKVLATFGSSDQSLSANTKTSPSSGAFTSASVLVLYIGPVEIPESWSSRELSSKCLQECTRRLLSQRQEFVEAFLEVTLNNMRILSVSQNLIYKHKREELYYAGVCSNDEQTFGIVTRKLDHKGSKKSQSSSSLGRPMRAHMCHVFKVIQHKSVLCLHSGGDSGKDGKSGGNGRSSKQIASPYKQKTIPVKTCVTIINAVQGIFTGTAIPGSRPFEESLGLTAKQPGLINAHTSPNSSNESMYANSSMDKSVKKKKLDVVDLRPSAYLSPSAPTGSILSFTPVPIQQNMYVPPPTSGGGVGAPVHTRSMSNPASEYPSSLGTPAYNQQRLMPGSGGGSGGGSSWYANDSPKEEYHPRTRSWENRSPGTTRRAHDRLNSSQQQQQQQQHHHEGSGSGGSNKHASGGTSGGGGGGSKNSNSGLQYDRARRFSDDSSLSSLSDSRASSPTKTSHHSSFASHSRSPSPNRSLSYSSRSRTPSPVPTGSRWTTHGYRPTRAGASAARRIKASAMAMEVGSIRNGAISPTSVARSFRGSRANLRRQGSESSIMDLQDLQSTAMTSQVRGGGGGVVIGGPGGLPPKNGPLSSSIGSVATITTIADKTNDPEECGRVAGWVASFDKLLEDELGVHTLLEFLKKEHCEENILFWKDTKDFKENAAQDKNLTVSVKKIYDEYLGPNSPNEVNIDDRVKKSIEARLASPPLNIFHEAFEQIYQLMKMDCYPRFKKSPLVKDCLLAEMEGKPLPIDLPQDSGNQQQQQQQQTQFTGIWKKHREFSFSRSLFGRFGRSRVQQEQSPQVNSVVDIWGVSPEKDSSPNTSDSRRHDKKGHNPSPRLRKANTVKESRHKRRSGGTSHSEREKQQRPSTSDSSQDFPPEDHLNIFQEHKRNVFEVNLPNKVTKIMAVPPQGTVSDAIRPVLIKQGYNYEIMELRFATNFKLIDSEAPASILIGQHIIVIKSKNTFMATFPDVSERIMPADGTKSIGDLFVSTLKDMGKLQNFSVAIEGARVPLELDTDTSNLVGQRVVVKYLPGPLMWGSDSNSDLQSKSKTDSSSSSGRTDIDDLLSMIERLSNDKLTDQRISPSPITPEPTSDQRSSSDDLKKLSPGEMRKRSLSQGKKRSPNSHHHHRPLAASKSSDSIDTSPPSSSHHGHHGQSGGRDRHRREKRPVSRDNALKPSSAMSHQHQQQKNLNITRTQSGGSMMSNGGYSSATSMSYPHHPHHPRSLSPPANVGPARVPSAQELRSQNISPPPPTSKPPPLPSYAKRSGAGSSRGVQPPASTRWSGVSFKSTDSASSEDSLTTDLPRHPKQHGGSLEGGLEMRPGSNSSGAVPSGGPQYFPRAHTPNLQYPQLGMSAQQQQQQQQASYQQNRPVNALRGTSGNQGSADYPDGAKNSYNSGMPSTSSSSGNLTVSNTQHIRKTSWQGKPMDYSNASHPLHLSVSRGHSQSIGSTLSSYPWHNAHTIPHQKFTQQPKRSSMPRTAAERRELLENAQLMEAGDQLVRQEISEFKRASSSEGGTSSNPSSPHTPLSPTTHTVSILGTEDPNHQRETFV